jgi:hypothetical protein
MSHKMFDVGIVGCVMADESQCCIFDDCPLFKQCFPDAYESWQKAVAKEKKEKLKVS